MRTLNPPVTPRIGAHVSVAGGILNAPANAVEATCQAFQMWVSSPRAWRLPTLDPTVDQRFRDLVADARLGPVLVHAPYAAATATADELDKLLPGRLGLVHTTSGQVVSARPAEPLDRTSASQATSKFDVIPMS